MAETLNLEKLNLRKEMVLDLKKTYGIKHQKAQVVLALDYSGSMDGLYANGTVQETVERLMPIAMAFDDNQEIDFYIFTQSYKKLSENITLNNLAGYINNKVYNKFPMGATSYAPVLQAIFDQFTKKTGIFGGRKDKLDYPVYVIFVTDGNCDDQSDTEKVMKSASHYGLFFQFVGIGRERFSFLDKLDNLSGRRIDNANFFKIESIRHESDGGLYDKLLKEFPSWLELARKHGMIY